MVALLLSRRDVGAGLGLFARVVPGRVVLAGDRLGRLVHRGLGRRLGRRLGRGRATQLVQCRAQVDDLLSYLFGVPDRPRRGRLGGLLALATQLRGPLRLLLSTPEA